MHTGRNIWRVSALSLAAALFITLKLSAASGLMPGADAKWRLYQSENFEVYSRNSDSESREFLHNLELVHAIFFETFGFKAKRKVPTTVYFFSRDKFFNFYKPEAYKKLEDTASIYSPYPDRGVLIVAPLPTFEAAQRLAFGGYSHHLFRLIDSRHPLWFGYGMAGILRNIEIVTPSFELGKAQPQQVQSLREKKLIPLDVMLGADHQSEVHLSNKTNSLLHDESWAMVHYLYFGEHKLPRENVSRFVNYTLEHGNDYDAEETRKQFEQHIGFDYKEMNLRLDRYFRNGRYSWTKRPLPSIPAAKTYTARTMTMQEINLRLAELALRVNNSAQGKLFLLQGLDDPLEAVRLNEALGTDAYRTGDIHVVQDRWERALAAGSKNPAILRELLTIEKRERFQRFDLYYRLPEDVAERLRALTLASIAAEPNAAEAYELLAWIEATAHAPSIKNINVVQKNFPAVKDKDRTMLALAVVRLRLGDKAGSAEILDTLAANEPNDWIKYGIEHTRATIEERPVDRDNLPAAGLSRKGPSVQFKMRPIQKSP